MDWELRGVSGAAMTWSRSLRRDAGLVAQGRAGDFEPGSSASAGDVSLTAFGPFLPSPSAPG
jgi:hypothetical protein